MQIYRYPLLNSWPEITKRPSADFLEKIETVSKVMSKIRSEGDAAIRKFIRSVSGNPIDVVLQHLLA